MLRRLYRQEPISLELALVMKDLAGKLSTTLGNNFNYLRNIMERHEPEVRRRWIGKTRDQRRALLLKVSSHMPERRRSDKDLEKHELLAVAIKGYASICDAILWTYINLEDLSKTQPLLVYLHSRAHNLPWTFVKSEAFFSPFASFPECLAADEEPLEIFFKFTKDPSPGVYGTMYLVERREPIKSGDGVELCERRGLRVLYTQTHILAFLAACCKAILHDKAEDMLMSASILASTSQFQADPWFNKGAEYSVFADTVLLAPYIGRSTVDFHRLRAYLAALVNTAKDHVWELREDPSCMADAIQNVQKHREEIIRDTKGNMHWSVSTPIFASSVAVDVVREAYDNLANFTVLRRITDRLCNRQGQN